MEFNRLCVIGIIILIVGFFIGISYETKLKEETKRQEIQLKIEMVKAGVTNIPSVNIGK